MDSIDKVISRIALSLVFLGLALSVALSGKSSNEPASPAVSTNVSAQAANTDEEFVKAAAANAIAKVELAKLAVAKASREEVKSFGQHIIDDDAKLAETLKKLARAKGFTLSKGSKALQAAKSRLQTVPADQFDNVYMAEMVQAQKYEITDFRREAKNNQDSDVKEFAARTLPMLEAHLKRAQNVIPSLKMVRSAAKPSPAVYKKRSLGTRKD